MELMIRIALGDDIDQMLDLRWTLEDEVEARGIGEVLDAGVGMEAMEVFVGVDEARLAEARAAMEALLTELGLEADIREVESGPPLALPPWQPGDCLSVPLVDDDGAQRFGAVIVLGRSDEGVLVGVLKHLSSRPPGAEVFAQREWLVLDHHAWEHETEVYWCFGDAETDFGRIAEVVGTTALRPTDPTTSPSWRAVDSLADQARQQAAWDEACGQPWPDPAVD